MRRWAFIAVLLLSLIACGKSPGPSAPATPAGSYRVVNVSAAVALAHAHSIAAINDVKRALGDGVTREDEKAGYDGLREQDEELTRRLTTALVTLLPDGTFAWRPAPAVFDMVQVKMMGGRWSLEEQRVTFSFDRLDDHVAPGPIVQIAATWEGDTLRLGKLSGKFENSGLEGVLLRRAPP